MPSLWSMPQHVHRPHGTPLLYARPLVCTPSWRGRRHAPVRALPPAHSAALQRAPSDSTHAEPCWAFEVSVYLEPCCVRMPSLTILSQSALNFRRSHAMRSGRFSGMPVAQQLVAEVDAHTNQRHSPTARSLGRSDRDAWGSYHFKPVSAHTRSVLRSLKKGVFEVPGALRAALRAGVKC